MRVMYESWGAGVHDSTPLNSSCGVASGARHIGQKDHLLLKGIGHPDQIKAFVSKIDPIMAKVKEPA
jgi:hypothetical protein